MTPELDERLVKDFPILYQERDYGMKMTAMYWGFPGDGWELLIRKLSEKLEAWNVSHPDESIVATQVKEKFGTLRFYYCMDIRDTPIKRTMQKIRNFMFSRRLGRWYWRISNFRRIFWMFPYEKIELLVYRAERESAMTCEECGGPGRLRKGGWVRTLCDGCCEKGRKS